MLLQFLHIHTYPRMKSLRIWLRSVIRKTQDLKSLLDRRLNILALGPDRMMASCRMCMVIRQHMYFLS